MARTAVIFMARLPLGVVVALTSHPLLYGDRRRLARVTSGAGVDCENDRPLVMRTCMVHNVPMTYLPPYPRTWARIAPEEAGVDSTLLAEAIAFAHDNECPWGYDLAVEKAIANAEPPPWNEVLGPLKPRGGPAGLVLRSGRIVAEWGDTDRVDPTFSASKSYIALCAGVAVRDELIRDLDDPVRDYGLGDFFEAEQNQTITWRHLLQQTSEWEGVLWDKPDLVDRNRVVGPGADDSAKGQHRDLQPPGTFWEYNDVRVNLLALCLTLLFRRGLADVLRECVMDPIGASHSWEWHGYRNSYVEIDGRRVQSVSGGAHWGGGIWISAFDHARVGLLVQNQGRWGDAQILPGAYVAAMLAPCPIKPVYGAMWWLNTNRAMFPGAPESSVFAYGAGANFIWVDAARDLVCALRWLHYDAMSDFAARLMASWKD